MTNPKQEKTFMLIKPDGVRKGLVGEILRRIEQRDLKIVALGMDYPTEANIDSHYPKDDAWLTRLGNKMLGTFETYKYDAVEEVGTADPLEIGKMIRGWLISYMTSGPVVKVVVEGVHAVDMVRKIVGPTLPYMAEMGTIRGDFSVDSPGISAKEKRAIMNLVHASETAAEAANEIKLWFGNEKIHSYQRLVDNL